MNDIPAVGISETPISGGISAAQVQSKIDPSLLRRGTESHIAFDLEGEGKRKSRSLARIQSTEVSLSFGHGDAKGKI
jgi:hypothetical protein